MAKVSEHAAQRYVERVNPRASVDDAVIAIMSSARIIDLAATVLPSRHYRKGSA